MIWTLIIGSWKLHRQPNRDVRWPLAPGVTAPIQEGVSERRTSNELVASSTCFMLVHTSHRVALITPKSNTKNTTCYNNWWVLFVFLRIRLRMPKATRKACPYSTLRETKCNAQRKHSWSGYTVTDMMKRKNERQE